METVLSDVIARSAPSGEDAQGLLERGDDVLASGRRAAVPEEVGCRRECRVCRSEAADVVLERGRRVLRVLAGGPALDERGDAGEILLPAGISAVQTTRMQATSMFRAALGK